MPSSQERQSMDRRKSSSAHYQAFPSLRPPNTRGAPPARNLNRTTSSKSNTGGNGGGGRQGLGRRKSSRRQPTPIPMRQLIVLAMISLCEQTAFNSISPYLPEMTGRFPEVDKSKIGVSVGLIASAFSIAQFVTNFFWGNLSDKIGRKPVILLGTILTAASFVGFGFSKNLWHAVVAQAVMGAVNGNQGVVSTCLGEITDRSNQSSAFAYLPMVYGLGAVVGPIIGGVLVNPWFGRRWALLKNFPYLLPNVVAGALLALDFFLSVYFLEESLAEAKELPPLGERIKSVFAWCWQFTSSTRPSYLRAHKGHHHHRHSEGEEDTTQPLLSEQSEEEEEERPDSPQSEDSYSTGDQSYWSGDDDENGMPTFFPTTHSSVPWSKVFTRSNVFLLITYTIFNFGMVANNSLYPIFVSSPEPTGRGIHPQDIGLSLSFAGVMTILYQIGFFSRIQTKIGTKASFRMGLGIFAVTFFAMPFVGYSKDIGRAWLWVELAVILAVKVVSSVTALTCAMLLITNCAPTPSSLGTLNGLAQTLASGGRAFGPFVSGGLFTLGTKLPKGELLPWGVFGGIAVVGFVLSFGIRDDVESGGEGQISRPNSSGQVDGGESRPSDGHERMSSSNGKFSRHSSTRSHGGPSSTNTTS